MAEKIRGYGRKQANAQIIETPKDLEITINEEKSKETKESMQKPRVKHEQKYKNNL